MNCRLGNKYLALVRESIQRIEREEQQAINNASDIIAKALIEGRNLFVTGTGHANMLAQEVFYRAGGLVLANAIFPHGLVLNDLPATLLSKLEQDEQYGRMIIETSPLRPGDVLIIASTAGRNGVVVEWAIQARKRGCTVIGITSLEFSRGVTSRHSSGKVLADVVDLVVNDGTPKGDATIQFDETRRVGPISSVNGILIIDLIMLAVMEKMKAAGAEVPIFISGNLDGGAVKNEEVLQKYKDRIFYL